VDAHPALPYPTNLAAGCQPVGGGPLSAEALALIQTLNRLVPNGGGSGGAAGRDGSSSKPGLCHNCGKPGLWSRQSPNKKRDGSGGGSGCGRGAGGG